LVYPWYGGAVIEHDEPQGTDGSGGADARPASGGADAESLSDAFWGVARQLRHLTRETLGPIDVTAGQSRALRILDHHGPLRLNALADHLRIAPRSATEVVDALEERHLVERRPDSSDRRATLVVLTDEGVRTGELIRAARRAEAERLFGCLSPADRGELARILEQLRR
jgi:DNA-binding MarR family transcriptional regulator